MSLRDTPSFVRSAPFGARNSELVGPVDVCVWGRNNNSISISIRAVVAGFSPPRRIVLGSQSRTRKHTRENRIHNERMLELQNAQHHNHIYNGTLTNKLKRRAV